MRVSIWPRSLISGITLVLFVAVLLQFIGNTLLYEQAEVDRRSALHIDAIAKQLVVAERVLSKAKPEDRSAMADALSAVGVTIEWQQRSAIDVGDQQPPKLGLLNEHLLALDAGLNIRDIEFDGQGSPSVESGEILLADGTVMRYRVRKLEDGFPILLSSLFSTALLAVGLIVIVIMIIRGLGASYRSLVNAADSVGRTARVTVPVQGPPEVRQLARAFNAMQDRISRLISDRTQALAAVSHDLRTPIARLRLRMDGVKDQSLQRAIEDDLDEMEKMVGSVLDYLKGDTDPEPPRLIDLVSLVTTLVDAATDAGSDATYDGPPYLALTIRPLAMKRAISNLIENALAYGDCARVALQCHERMVSLSIDDDGPGIHLAEQQRVLEPFYRLDESRNRNTGGVGLGLTIARRVVEAEGGKLTLGNKSDGGLRAQITFPLT